VLSLDVETLKKAGITRVLSVMAHNPHAKHIENTETWSAAGISRDFIMMQDIVTFQSHAWYQTTSAIIDSALHANERILIHWYLQTNPSISLSSSASVSMSLFSTAIVGMVPDP